MLWARAGDAERFGLDGPAVAPGSPLARFALGGVALPARPAALWTFRQKANGCYGNPLFPPP
jgi:hypothetical protein